MAPKKKAVGLIKLQIKAGEANPAPPVGPALGQHGVNIMEFCKAYNAATDSQRGNVVPVEITVYEDRSFTFALKTPPDAFRTYRFNKHVIDHHFCPTCGTAPFSEGTDPKGNKMVAINLRCVEGIDPRALNIHFHNGIAD